MKIKNIFLTLYFFATYICFSQNTEGVSIAGSVTPPHPSAMLDIQSTNKGLLIPRVTQVSDVPNPTEGLLVYQIGSNPGMYFWNGSAWQCLSCCVQPTLGDGIWYSIGAGGKMSDGTPVPNYNTNVTNTDNLNNFSHLPNLPCPLNTIFPVNAEDLKIKKENGIVTIKGKYVTTIRYAGVNPDWALLSSMFVTLGPGLQKTENGAITYVTTPTGKYVCSPAMGSYRWVYYFELNYPAQ